MYFIFCNLDLSASFSLSLARSGGAAVRSYKIGECKKASLDMKLEVQDLSSENAEATTISK